MEPAVADFVFYNGNDKKYYNLEFSNTEGLYKSINDPFSSDLFFVDGRFQPKIKKVAIIENTVIDYNLDLTVHLNATGSIADLDFTEDYVIATINQGYSEQEGLYNMSVCVILRETFVVEECLKIDQFAISTTIKDEQLIILQRGSVTGQENSDQIGILFYNLKTKQLVRSTLFGRLEKIFLFEDKLFIYGKEDFDPKLKMNLYELKVEPNNIENANLSIVTKLNSDDIFPVSDAYDNLGNFYMLNNNATSSSNSQ